MKPWHGHPIAEDTQVSYSEAGGRSVAWVEAANCTRSDRYALFCHGGGFVSCDMADYLFFAEIISRLLDCRVVVPDYRLAPEHRYPAALDDCVAAYYALLEREVPANSIFTTGDSCGGGLAVSVILRARDEGRSVPACHLGLTGWYDLKLDKCHTDEGPRTEPMITPGWFRNRVADYLAEASVDEVYASPAGAKCDGLPPLLLQVGENDLTSEGARRLAERASAAGVDATLSVKAGMVHGFHGLVNSGVPESAEAWAEAKSFIDLHVV
jgi:acetyl esterase/lipase